MQMPCSSLPPLPEQRGLRSSKEVFRARLRTLALITAGVALFVLGASLVSFEQLVAREDQLRAYCSLHPFLAFGLAFLIYTAATGLSLPAAAGLTLVTAWLFGFWPSLLLVSFASTSGASLSFLASRWLLGRQLQQRHGQRIRQLQEALERDGVQYLLLLRLTPLMPFFMVNLLLGLTRMPLWTFWWASQLGMLPGTAVYVAAGAAAPTLRQLADDGLGGVVKPEVMLTLALLGCLPLVLRLLSRRLLRT